MLCECALGYDQTSEEGIECIKGLTVLKSKYCAWLIRFGRKPLWIYQGRITENFENEAGW